MDRINKIITHPMYIEYLTRNDIAEKDRYFCKHGFQHALDVARVAYIIAMEEGFQYGKDTVYAAGLLHDIGRWKEYADGSDHAIVSAELAETILHDCGFSEEEVDKILQAIKNHRIKKSDASLSAILYNSDKKCRNCIQCNAKSKCKRFANDELPEFYY